MTRTPVKSSHVKSVGHCVDTNTLKIEFKDHPLIGRVFGRLTVVGIQGRNKSGVALALCSCTCGSSKVILASSLYGKATESCGCIRKEQLVERLRKHGLSKTAEYKIWIGIKKRCFNEKCKSFARYGGRGITVCADWMNFETFLRDMGPRPSPSHSVDRYPDQNGAYERTNCRWATPIEQGNNMSNNVLVEYDGETMSVAVLARRINKSPNTLYGRVSAGIMPSEVVNRKDRRFSA